MMQSSQHNEDFQTFCSVCSFCLSINRRTTPVLQLSESMLNLTTFNLYSQSAQLCWECKSRLKNYSEFCEQAERAQEVLNRVNTQESLNGKSLSRLVISSTLLISIDFQTPDKNDKISSDNTQLVQNLLTIKNERETLKEESDVLDGFQSSNQYEGDYSESMHTNNCHKPMLEINISLKKDDDSDVKYTDKLEAKNDAKCFNTSMEDIQNATTTKNIHLSKSHARNSSIASFSSHLEIDYNLYEKFIATEHEMRESLKILSLKNKCKICLREFKNIDNFFNHMKKFHSECVGEHECDVCGFGQPTESALKLHREQHYELYRCLADGCRFVHKFPPSLNAHQTVHKSTRKNFGAYECKHCKKKFQNVWNVYKHQIRCTHLDATKCKHCSKDFSDRKSLNQHMNIIHVDKMLVCDVCGVKFPTLRELQAHLILHRNLSQKKYECKICQKNFSCRFKERVHQFVHNGKPRIKCHICKTEFIEEEARIKHLEHRHGMTKEEISQNLLSDAKQSKRCRKKKEGSTKCELCEKEFRYPSVLQYHVMTQHSEDRPFKCHVCSDGFKTKPILDNHIRKHSDERAFKCDVCNKGFKYEGNLYTHKILHTGEKPFMCNICGTSFAHKGNLKAHMKIHTGEKKFDCNVCGKKFPTNSCLKKHSRIH